MKLDFSGFQLAHIKSGSILKSRRIGLGLTQQQAADKAGILLQQYQKFENGDRELLNSSFMTACKVIEALGMDIASFYHGEYVFDEPDVDTTSSRLEKRQPAESERAVPYTPITRIYFVPNLNAASQQRIEITISEGTVSLNPLRSFCFSANDPITELARTHGFPNSKPLTKSESAAWISALNRIDILSWKRRYAPEQQIKSQRSPDDPNVEYIPGVVDPFEETAAASKGIALNWMLEIDRSDRKRTKYISGYGIYPAGFERFLELLCIVAPDFIWKKQQ